MRGQGRLKTGPRRGSGSAVLRSRRAPTAWLLGALATFGLLVAPAVGQSIVESGVVRYGLLLSTFTEVNPNDALAATETWSAAVGRATGAWKATEATLFPDAATMVKAVNANRVDVIALTSAEYLAVESTVLADPFLVYELYGQVEAEYVLLVRNNIRSIAELRDGRLAIAKTSASREMADTWLDVVLLENGLPEKERAFSQVNVTKKRSQAIVAVFFKQADAAVVTRTAFQTAVELNPQLGREIKVLAQSPKLLTGLACIRRSIDMAARRRYVEQATKLHEQTGLRQTFLILQVTRLVAWDPHFLDTARALNARYDALRRKAGER